MARLDSITAALWSPGSLTTGIIADGTTLVSVTGLPAGWYLLGATGTCDVAWAYDFQIQDSGGNVVASQSQRRNCAAGNEDFYLPSAIRITAAGGRVVLILRGGITTVLGLQMAIYSQMGSIG